MEWNILLEILNPLSKKILVEVLHTSMLLSCSIILEVISTWEYYFGTDIILSSTCAHQIIWWTVFVETSKHRSFKTVFGLKGIWSWPDGVTNWWPVLASFGVIVPRWVGGLPWNWMLMGIPNPATHLLRGIARLDTWWDRQKSTPQGKGSNLHTACVFLEWEFKETIPAAPEYLSDLDSCFCSKYFWWVWRSKQLFRIC